MQGVIWLALGYNAPVEPSKARVYIWRKLKECGAEYFRSGVAVLPNTPENMTFFLKLAAKIREMGGDAVIAELKYCEPKDEAEMINRFIQSSEKEYRELMRDGKSFRLMTPPQRAELLKKLAKRYGKARSRDFFSSRDSVTQGLIDLADDMERVASGLGRQLRHLLDI